MGWSVNRPTGLTFHRTGSSTKGYTLLTPHGDTCAYLIDIDGRVVHRWRFEHIRPGYGRLLPNGNLLMTGQDVDLPDPPPDEPTKAPPPLEQHVTRLGGYHTTLCEVDWDGNVVWEYVNRFQHHDFHRFANGNTMVPEWVELPEELHRKVRGGFKMPRERLPPLLSDDLVEVDAELNEVRRIHVWELLDPVKDPIDPTIRRWEWTHLNGFDVDDAGNIVFSAWSNNRVAVISADTGEITFRFRETRRQHDPTWVDGGNIQVFDNGSETSRVVEIDPRTSEVVWEYRGKPSYQFFSGHISARVAALDRQRARVRRHQRAPVRGHPEPRGRVGVDQPVRELPPRRAHRLDLPRAPVRRRLLGTRRPRPRPDAARQPEPAARAVVTWRASPT